MSLVLDGKCAKNASRYSTHTQSHTHPSCETHVFEPKVLLYASTTMSAIHEDINVREVIICTKDGKRAGEPSDPHIFIYMEPLGGPRLTGVHRRHFGRQRRQAGGQNTKSQTWRNDQEVQQRGSSPSFRNKSTFTFRLRSALVRSASHAVGRVSMGITPQESWCKSFGILRSGVECYNLCAGAELPGGAQISPTFPNSNTNPR